MPWLASLIHQRLKVSGFFDGTRPSVAALVR